MWFLRRKVAPFYVLSRPAFNMLSRHDQRQHLASIVAEPVAAQCTLARLASFERKSASAASAVISLMPESEGDDGPNAVLTGEIGCVVGEGEDQIKHEFKHGRIVMFTTLSTLQQTVVRSSFF